MAHQMARSDVGTEVIPVLTGTFLSGAMMSLFLLTIPVILETASSTTQLLQQWNRIFYRGHIQGPLISISTGMLYSYAAWSRAKRGGSWRPFALSAALTVGMIPFTWIFMARVNGALFNAVAATEKGYEGNRAQADSLVKSWGQWNAMRAMFPLSGAVVGLLGICKLIAF